MGLIGTTTLASHAAIRTVRRLLGVSRFLTFPSFEAAAHGIRGYEDPAIVDVVARKTQRLRETLQPGDPARSRHTTQALMAVILAARVHGAIDVVEFGGACGATFFELDAVMPDAIGRWQVVETRAMVAVASQRFGGPRLSFRTGLGDPTIAASPDLIFCQGALQFVAHPLQILAGLLRLQPRVVYVGRTLVSTGTERAIYSRLHSRLSAHGPGSLPAGVSDAPTATALNVLPFGMLVDQLGDPYQCIVRFEEDEDLPDLAAAGDAETVRTRGFLAVRMRS